MIILYKEKQHLAYNTIIKKNYKYYKKITCFCLFVKVAIKARVPLVCSKVSRQQWFAAEENQEGYKKEEGCMQPLIRKRIGEEHTREKQDLRAFVTFVAFSRHGMHLILYCTRFNRQIFSHTAYRNTEISFATIENA